MSQFEDIDKWKMRSKFPKSIMFDYQEYIQSGCHYDGVRVVANWSIITINRLLDLLID